MTQYVDRHGLSVAEPLAALIENDVLTDVSPDQFWSGYAALLRDLAPQNADLLAKRANLQRRIDDWHIARRGQPFDGEAYRAFLAEIGYLETEPGPFAMSTENVDPEIASIAGPQLVVPVMNARFALNAANARWGSLYDALYGTDAIEGEPQGRGYDAARGAQVIAWARAHLDDVTPLDEGSWTDVSALAVRDGGLCVTVGETETTLADAEQLAGYTESGNIFLRAHGHAKPAIPHRKRADIGPATLVKRCDIVQMRALPGEDLRPARGIIAAALRLSFDRVSAVKRIIQRPPPRICSIERKARIHHRHHKLRSGDAGDLGIDILGRHRERARLGFQIPDLGQKGAIRLAVERLAPARDVPVVDPALQIRALGQQRGVLRGQVAQQRRIAGPEPIRRNVRQNVILDKVCKRFGHRQPVAVYVFGHIRSPFDWAEG